MADSVKRKARKGWVTMIVQSPTDRNQTAKLPVAVAFAAARGIARETHHAVILDGTYGRARFYQNGGGNVEWNELSTMPGQTSEFDERTTVMLD